LFLHDVLKYSWDEVHEEAERLEHFISERFEERVAAILGDPEFDPHGHVIPARHEAAARRHEVLLAEWPSGKPAAVSSVSDRNAAALRELERLGLMPGAVLTVERRNAAGSVAIRLRGQEASTRLSGDLAGLVRVTPQSAE
jgi:DtxR family Mn-dependent transcriptional regulator